MAVKIACQMSLRSIRDVKVYSIKECQLVIKGIGIKTSYLKFVFYFIFHGMGIKNRL